MDNSKIKYLENGQAVLLLKSLEPGFLVQDIYQNEDFEEDPGEIYPLDNSTYYIEKVFNRAPTVKYDDRIVELQKQIEALKQERRDIEKQVRESQYKHKAFLEKCSKFKQLQRLEDFIDGKIKFLAFIDNYQLKIEKIEDQKSEYGNGDLRLLSLYGGSKGNLEWRLNQYSDGSGSNTTVVPCITYKDAVKEIQNAIATRIINPNMRPSVEIIKKARKFNVPVPSEYVDKAKQEALTSLYEELQGNTECRERIEKKIAEIEDK